jgi:hypothetical protein
MEHDETLGPDDELPAEDELIGMGFFPDELGLAGSAVSTLGGIHRPDD